MGTFPSSGDQVPPIRVYKVVHIAPEGLNLKLSGIEIAQDRDGKSFFCLF